MPVVLVGKKCGMTRVFTEDGVSVPVTVLEVQPNIVTQVKTEANDGYRALQVTSGSKKPSRINSALAGHYAKANVEAGEVLSEIRLDTTEMPEAKIGDAITVAVFEAGNKVDVQGTSKGKGFAGTVKRHNFRMQDATHGNSLSHRAPGSMGQNQTPGRVVKGKKMAGHMGSVIRTAQGLEVVKVDVERNLLLIKGAIPGAPGGRVSIKRSVKQRGGQ